MILEMKKDTRKSKDEGESEYDLGDEEGYKQG